MAGTKIANLIGRRFGRLVVIAPAEPAPGYMTRWVCRCDCGVEKTVRQASLKLGKTQSCGCLHKEEAFKRAWKGGRSVHKRTGYVRVYAPDHPNRNEKCYVAEHVLVMSEKLGRPLKDGESVHHKNGVRSDNRDDNLELRRHYHPPGQTPTDITVYAIELLTDYSSFLTDDQKQQLRSLSK